LCCDGSAFDQQADGFFVVWCWAFVFLTTDDSLLVVSILQAFAPLPVLTASSSLTTRSAPLLQLDGCRNNAKKEKIKRNRENMRKYKIGGGKKGLSRRKLLRKSLSSRARVIEAAFIAKCFIAGASQAASADDGLDANDNDDKN
jgi:hypothetical protein